MPPSGDNSDMTIRYQDGRSVRAIQLSRVDNTIRVAIHGEDDSRLFECIDGTWVSEDCEPVSIDFEWQLTVRRTVPAEEVCIYSQELAATLMDKFLNPERDELEEELRKLHERTGLMAASARSRLVS